MDQDLQFRFALLAVLGLLMPVLLYHRIKSQATGEKLDRWQEGPFILFTLRAIAALNALGLFARMIEPRWMVWSSMPLPPRLRWTSLALIASGGALAVWTFRTLGPNLTDTVVTRERHTLVTTGPYRFVRHPFYDAMALLLLGVSLILANWFLLLTGALLLALVVMRTDIEEARLLARFGDEYVLYTRQTGRFLPRIRKKGTEDH